MNIPNKNAKQMRTILMASFWVLLFTACNNPSSPNTDEQQVSKVQKDSSQDVEKTKVPIKEENIEAFLDRFLGELFWEKDLKKIVATGNPALKPFEYEAFPLQVMWSMGAYCRNYKAPYEAVLALRTNIQKMPPKSKLAYKNETPFQEISVCELDEIGWEGAPEPAIYYYRIAELPEVPSDDFQVFNPIDALGTLKSKQLYRVVYWGGSLDSYYDFYFAEENGQFYWVLWNLCNCEA